MARPALRSLALRGLALAAGLLLSALALVAVELGFRLFGPASDALPVWLPVEGRRPTDEAEILANHVERTQLHRPDVRLFWRNRPGVDLTLRGARIRTNRLGLRDAELPRAKPEGELRLLVLGESTAFGDEVEQDEVFVEVLERALDRRATGCRISVINAAVSGYSLFQSARYLERDGLALEPDAVLLYHGYNDFLPTTYAVGRTGGTREAVGRTDRELFLERTRWPVALDLHLRQASAAWRWLRTPVPEASVAPGGYRRSRVRRVPEEDRRALLASMRGLLDRQDVALVVLVPVYEAFGKHREVLLEFAEASGTRTIDLLPTVPRRPRDRAGLFRSDGIHPTPELHERIARSLEREIVAAPPTPELAACLGSGA